MPHLKPRRYSHAGVFSRVQYHLGGEIVGAVVWNARAFVWIYEFLDRFFFVNELVATISCGARGVICDATPAAGSSSSTTSPHHSGFVSANVSPFQISPIIASNQPALPASTPSPKSRRKSGSGCTSIGKGSVALKTKSKSQRDLSRRRQSTRGPS